MAGNPRENVKKKGFWSGGSSSHGAGQQSGGRDSGFPGGRRSTLVGIRIDLETPTDDSVSSVSQEAPGTKPKR